MFFDGSMRSMRRIIRRSPTTSSSSRGGRVRLGRVGDLAQRVGVGPERRRERDAATRVGSSISCTDAVVRARPAVGVEAARHRRHRRAELRRRRRSGSTRIEFGPQNGVWVKCATRRSGRARAHDPGHERELVVLHEHDVVRRRRARATAAAKRSFTSTYAGPRVVEVAVEAGPAHEVEHPVVQEPQRAVRDDVVVEAGERGVEVEQHEVEARHADRAGAAARRGRRR